MNTLPYFRKIVRAIGEHNNPAKTAYRYELIEFLPSGTYQRIPDLLITKTQMRMINENRHFEEQVAGQWKLIDTDTFKSYEAAWNEKHLTLGYTPINDEGI